MKKVLFSLLLLVAWVGSLVWIYDEGFATGELSLKTFQDHNTYKVGFYDEGKFWEVGYFYTYDSCMSYINHVPSHYPLMCKR